MNSSFRNSSSRFSAMELSNDGSSRSALDVSTHGGQRELSQNGESPLVLQLRKDLAKMQHEKAEMELTLMNQMSNLAYENQTTIDSLRSKLTQSEQLVETLQAASSKPTAASSSSSSFSHSTLEIQQLRKSLNEEKGLRKSLEEERDAQSQETTKIKEERDSCESKMRDMQQKMQGLESSNAYLSNQVRTLETEKQDAVNQIRSLKNDLSEMEHRHEVKLSSLEQLHNAAMEDAERSHQFHFKKVEREFQQQLQSPASQPQSDVNGLHSQIGALEQEKENLSRHLENLHVELQDEQFKNQVLEQSLGEEKARCSELWYSLEDSQKRCDKLEEELSQQYESNNNNSQLQSQNELLSNQIASVRDQFVNEQEKTSKLQRSLEQEKTTNAKLRESLREHQSRYEDLNRNLHRSHSGMGLAQGKITALEKEKAALADKVSQLEQHLDEEQSKSCRSREGHLEQEFDKGGGRQNDAAALESAQLELQSVMNSYQSDVARLERDIQSVQEELTGRNRQYQRLEAEINEERRIRKSLTAQLSLLKKENRMTTNAEDVATDESNSNSFTGSNSNHENSDTELEDLRKETIYLRDQIKIISRNSKVDPAEVEFLRKQNRMLGDRANGLHGEQMKELENLRQENKELLEELHHLKKDAPDSHNESASSFRQSRQQSAEIDGLRNQNKSLSEDLNALRRHLALEQDGASVGSTQSPGGLQKSFNQRSTRSLGGTPRHAPSSPRPHGRTESPSSMQTPPLSPPLMRKRTRNKDSLQSQVGGIVESFERRISRTNSGSSLASVGGEAQVQMNAQSQPCVGAARLQGLSQGCVPGDEVGESQLDSERAHVQELEIKYKNECELVRKLREELSETAENGFKRSELENLLKESQKEVQRLRLKVREFERKFEDVEHVHGELLELRKTEASRSNMEELLKEREHEIQKLQSQIRELEEQASEVYTLREELSKMDQIQFKCSSLETMLQEREMEIKELRTKLDALQDIALQVDNYRQAMESEKSTVQCLQQHLQSETEMVDSLKDKIARMEEDAEAQNEVQQRCDDSEDEVRQLRSKVGELEALLADANPLSSDHSELDRVKGELAQAQVASQEFEKKVYEDRAEIERLKSQIFKAQKQQDETQREIERLSKENSVCKASQDRLERKSREDEELIEQLQGELGAARIGLEKSLDDLERMKMQSSASEPGSRGRDYASMQKDKEEIKELRAELIVAKEALDTNVAEMEKLQKCMKESDASRMIAIRQNLKNCNDGQEEIDRLSIEVASERENNKNKSEEISRLRDQVEALQQELHDALNYVEELKTTIGNIKNAHDSELQDFQKIEKRTSRSMGTEVNTLTVELTKNQMDRANTERKYMGKIHELESTIESMQAEMDEELEDKIKQLNSLQQDLTQKEDEVLRLEKEREQICSSMNNISSTRKDEMDQLQEELLKLVSKTAAQTREIQGLKMQLEEHDYRKSEFDRLKTRIEELEEDLRKMPAKRGDVSQSDLEILKKENVMLRESIRELGLERRALQEKLDALVAEKSTSKTTQVLRERNAVLKKEVERLTKRLKKMEHSMTRFTI